MIIYTGKIINVRKDDVKLDNGRSVMREVVEHPGSAAIIPFLSENEIILIQLYRYAVGKIIYEIPAGTLDKGETFAECAARELEEEIGYKAGKLEPLVTLYPSPGILNECMYIYKATNLMRTQTNYQTDESIKGVVQVKLTDAWEMIRNGEIQDSKTVCSILMCMRFK